MTKEEYEAKMKTIVKEYNDKVKALNEEYALSNNPYKIGDVITDHYHTIRIERISTYLADGVPMCEYSGVVLKKDGSPKKRQEHTWMFQEDIREVK